MYFTRNLAHATVKHEIDRARDTGDPFVLGLVCIDGLDELGDYEGIAAGTALMYHVVDALKSNLRYYDPVVRVGYDEFLCGFLDTELPAARRRIEEIRLVLEATPAASGYDPDARSISVGLARLRSADNFETLTARADNDLYSHQQTRRRIGRALTVAPVQAGNAAATAGQRFGGGAPPLLRGWAPERSAATRAFNPWPSHTPHRPIVTPDDARVAIPQYA
ncbi:MAG: GGDEF domain-containing protein [Actinomycetota bacterium]|nr:GGDEF domain-containing protein [Actinomycetota bacterium]